MARATPAADEHFEAADAGVMTPASGETDHSTSPRSSGSITALQQSTLTTEGDTAAATDACMRRRARTRPSWALWALLGLGGLGSTQPDSDGRNALSAARSAPWLGAGVAAAQGASVSPRWGQASALLSTGDAPTFVVASGKTPISGQTVDSTPPTSSALSLDLSNPITDLASPPWQSLAASGSAPDAAKGVLVPLSSASALFFGGDARGDPSIALPAGNDSAYLLAYSGPDKRGAPAWTHENAWTEQPQRREGVFAASASNGIVTRTWVYGGLRPDGSETAFDELWELQTQLDPKTGAVQTSQWALWHGPGGPPAMYDGAAVLMPTESDTPGALPSIFLVGGVQQNGPSPMLADLSTSWVFTPGDSLGSGSWAQLKLSRAPTARRDHVALNIGGGKVWLHGGRSMDGSTVLSDAAVLDTRRRRWTAVSSGPTVWSHSAVSVGDTVLLAFGYGQNAPAPTALSVYAPGNDTWLASYTPSYLTPISNPKAGSSDAPAVSGASTAASGTTAASSASMGTASESISPSEPSTATGSKDSAQGSAPPRPGQGPDPTHGTASPEWTAPGGAMPSPTSSKTAAGGTDGNASSDSQSKSSSHSSTSLIAGAVVGSVLGALALGAGGVFAVKRHRDRSAYGRHTYSSGYGYGDGPGGFGLMTEQQPSGGGGPAGVFAGLLTPKKRHPAGEAPRGTRRFDMLDEEADENWSAGGWTRFDDMDEGALALGDIVPSLRGRGSPAVWDGFGGAGALGRQHGTARSSRSFLGGALGGFVGAHSDTHEGSEAVDPPRRSATSSRYAPVSPIDPPTEESAAVPSLGHGSEETDDPFAERFAVESGETHSTLSHATPSAGTHGTGSTRPTSLEVTPRKAAAIGRSFSPASGAASLYGSSFAGPQRDATEAVLGRAQSGASQASGRPLARSNSSWWSRLNLQKSQHGVDVPTPTAGAAIRDPAPAPSMAVIAEADPFLDDESQSEETAPSDERLTAPDEHGRLGGGSGHLVHGQHDRSVASSISDATATSSVLEERLRNMDVVQRIHSGSIGGDSTSIETTPTLGHGPPHVLPLPGSSVDPFADPEVLLPMTNPRGGPRRPSPAFGTRPEGLEMSAPDPTGSPRRRIAGPRPEPAATPAPPLPRSNSVKDMVANFEKRSAPADHGAKEGARGPKAAPREKVVHGLAKKPRLYVANPDGDG
ncbi:hypothetical protein JCM8202_002248 [Rhodotorula sphaerocarpa]